MKKSNVNPADQEPYGIVISQGSRGDRPAVCRAYVWLSVNELEEESADSKAA